MHGERGVTRVRNYLRELRLNMSHHWLSKPHMLMRRLGIFFLLASVALPLPAFAQSKAERQQARQQAAINRMVARPRPAPPQPRGPSSMPAMQRPVRMPQQRAFRPEGAARAGRMMDADGARPLRDRGVFDQPRVQREFQPSAPEINTAAVAQPPTPMVNPRADRRDADRADRMRDLVNRNRERRDRDRGDRDARDRDRGDRGGRNRGGDFVAGPSQDLGGQVGGAQTGAVTSPTTDADEGHRHGNGDRDGDRRHRGDRHRNWHERHEGDPNFDRKHRRWHNREYWRRNYNRFVLFGGGYYYWNRGYWYPAYGYDPYYSTYTYEAPLYSYNGLPPGQIIALVQTKLQQRGYYNAAVDGTYGPRTEQAILDFQAAEGLPMTGEIDQETLNALDFD